MALPGLPVLRAAGLDYKKGPCTVFYIPKGDSTLIHFRHSENVFLKCIYFFKMNMTSVKQQWISIKKYFIQSDFPYVGFGLQPLIASLNLSHAQSYVPDWFTLCVVFAKVQICLTPDVLQHSNCTAAGSMHRARHSNCTAGPLIAPILT